MLLSRQRQFVEKEFSAERHSALLQQIQAKTGIETPWRTCETSAFIDSNLSKKLQEASIALTMQCTTPEMKAITNAAIDPRYNVPNEADRPLFAIVDFAIAGSEEEGFYPKLIELQGFPSVYAYQHLLGTESKSVYNLEGYTHLFGGLQGEEYIDILRTLIVGNHHPDDVCLLEYKPEQQKTRPDFLATQYLLGVRETDICSVRKEGRTLLHQRNGKWIPIRRVYNRAIVDELEENRAELPFDWQDDLDVEWAGHPNWYFRMSKFNLPFLKHDSVPTTTFLDKLTAIPEHLDDYVLKPLFAFAGKGVNMNPTAADIAAVPEHERHLYVLQEKVKYAECLFTPEGLNKVELRMMLIWKPEDAQPTPLTGLIRTGRGPMMGVRFNSLPWTGSSAIFMAE